MKESSRGQNATKSFATRHFREATSPMQGMCILILYKCAVARSDIDDVYVGQTYSKRAVNRFCAVRDTTYTVQDEKLCSQKIKTIDISMKLYRKFTKITRLSISVSVPLRPEGCR